MPGRVLGKNHGLVEKSGDVDRDAEVGVRLRPCRLVIMDCHLCLFHRLHEGAFRARPDKVFRIFCSSFIFYNRSTGPQIIFSK